MLKKGLVQTFRLKLLLFRIFIISPTIVALNGVKTIFPDGVKAASPAYAFAVDDMLLEKKVLCVFVSGSKIIK